MGYRGPYVKSIARSVVSGKIDLESLRPGRLSDDEVEEALLELDGVGPYAAAHIMQLLGYHRKLIFDSWTRPKFRKLTGKKQAKDSTIERLFARYKGYAGLAFWLFLTRDWHEQKGNLERPS
jgi:3-methyladenine DNA glycosylase/8-oxoguanine DNA glycosylase